VNAAFGLNTRVDTGGIANAVLPAHLYGNTAAMSCGGKQFQSTWVVPLQQNTKPESILGA
jgi:hypothetical protein